MRLLLIFALLLPACAADRVWKVSLGAAGISSAVDAASSWGRPERNPALGARFGVRGAIIKVGIFAGTAALQAKMPRYRKAWTVLNFAAAGVSAGVAIRNARVR